jgi:isocitrate/isopropylmalate dehydrogenase
MKIAVLPGDGIGIEVTRQAVKVLRAALGKRPGLELHEAPIGGAGIAAAGEPLPPATLEAARRADAILFGAAGCREMSCCRARNGPAARCCGCARRSTCSRICVRQ